MGFLQGKKILVTGLLSNRLLKAGSFDYALSGAAPFLASFTGLRYLAWVTAALKERSTH